MTASNGRANNPFNAAERQIPALRERRAELVGCQKVNSFVQSGLKRGALQECVRIWRTAALCRQIKNTLVL